MHKFTLLFNSVCFAIALFLLLVASFYDVIIDLFSYTCTSISESDTADDDCQLFDSPELEDAQNTDVIHQTSHSSTINTYVISKYFINSVLTYNSEDDFIK